MTQPQPVAATRGWVGHHHRLTESEKRGFPSWYSWKRVTTRCCGPASPEPRNPLPASNQEYLSGNPLSEKLHGIEELSQSCGPRVHTEHHRAQVARGHRPW